jgi:Spy/CpxP family protein refolding chaperone
MPRQHTICLLLALLGTLTLAAVAQEDFVFEPFEMSLGPGHAGMPLPPPHHGAIFMADAMPAEMPGALPMDPMHLVMLARHLDLTKEQRAGIGKVMDDVLPQLRDLMFRVADARDEVESARTGEKDEAALRALADAQGKLHADMLFLRLSAQQRVRRLLNDDQRAKLDSGMSGWRGPRGMMHGPRAGGTGSEGAPPGPKKLTL